MVDVTGGTPPTGASPFRVPEDIKAVYDHFGAPEMFSVATVANLPASGNWEGRILLARDTGVQYRWTGGGWKYTAGGDRLTAFRSNTALAVKDAILMTGVAVGTTDAGGLLGNAFPTPFPTACVGVQLMPDHQSGFAGGNLPYLVNGSVSRTGFVTLWPSAPGVSINLAYVAFGY